MQFNDEYATVINFTNDDSLDIMVGPFCTMQDASEFAATSAPANATDATAMVLTGAAGAAVSWLSVFSATSLIERLDFLLGREEPPVDDEESSWVIDVETPTSRHVVGPFVGLAAAADFVDDEAALAAISGDDSVPLFRFCPLLRQDLSRQPAAVASNVEAFSALAQMTTDAVAAC